MSKSFGKPWRPWRSSRSKRSRPARRDVSRLRVEALEDRHLLAAWVPVGPAPSINGQVEKISPNHEVVGSIHTVLAHPTDANTLFIGATNGGVWKTSDATATSPAWTPLTDQFSSLSIGAMAMDPSDSETILVGNGRFSSFGLTGGNLGGLLLSQDGGTTWAELNDPLLMGENISGVAIRGDILLATSNGNLDRFEGKGGLFRSTDGGTTWSLVSTVTDLYGDPINDNGLDAGSVLDLVGDPTEPNRFYTSVADVGIFLSEDAGESWSNITVENQELSSIGWAIRAGGNNNTELAIGVLIDPFSGEIFGSRLYAAVLQNGQTSYIAFTDDQGGEWTRMDLPLTNETEQDVVGLSPRAKPGSQGAIHFSIVVDPSDAGTVYVGGDRQPGMFPNSIGANDFTGRLFRGDTRIEATFDAGLTQQIPSPQWEHLTHSDQVYDVSEGGTRRGSAPHAGSREMVFDANGDLIEVDDGGIYRRTSPQDNTGDWFSIIGNLQVTEFHNIAYDSNSNVLIGGAQDVGTLQQVSPGSSTWEAVPTHNLVFPNPDPFTQRLNEDGGDVVVDDTSKPGHSYRYSSTQGLAFFRRQLYDSNNELVDQVALDLPEAGATLPIITPLALNQVDQRHLVVAGTNTIYESFNRGEFFSVVPGPNGLDAPGVGESQNAIAYGGYREGVPSSNVLYVGSGAEVLIRDGSDDNLQLTKSLFPGSTVRDIVLDRNDWMTAFVIDRDRVFLTTDLGDSWTDLTGNLQALDAGELRVLEFLSGNDGSVVVVGTDGGVFVSSGDNPGTWNELGSDLPNAPVYDLEYDQKDDILAVGTLGRGAWSLASAGFEASSFAAGGGGTGGGGTDTGPESGQKGSISGFAFNDLDGDQLFDSHEGEQGVASVYVYVDLNGNGYPNLTEPSVVTQNDGNYKFEGVPFNQYTVRHIHPDGAALSFPTVETNFAHQVDLNDTQHASGYHFAFGDGGGGNIINEAPTVEDQPFSVAENSQIGAIVGTVVASDPNSEDILSWSITSGSGANFFTLGQSDGVIRVGNGSALDHESISSFSLVVEVSDNGDPSLTDTATISIAINNVNEAPVASSPQSFEITQDVPNGIVVGGVQASDPDTGDTLNYAITNGSGQSFFSVSTETGDISLSDSSGLEAGTYQLDVLVTDSGNPSLSTTAEINIEVRASLNDIAFRLETTDLEGHPIETVPQGDDFELRVYVKDNRPVPTGVFAAYLDVEYDNQENISLIFGETQQLMLTDRFHGQTDANGNVTMHDFTGGSFFLTKNGLQTAPIPFTGNILALTNNIDSNLEQLLGVGNVEVVHSPVDLEGTENDIYFSWDITFVGDLQAQDIENLGVDVSGLVTTDGQTANASVTEISPADISNPITFINTFLPGELYGQGQAGIREGEGIFSEVGSFSNRTSFDSENLFSENLLFSIAFNAEQLGHVTFLGNAAELARQTADDVGGVSDVLVFSTEPSEIPTSRVDYGDSAIIQIVEATASSAPALPGSLRFTNTVNPFDVNDDGTISPVDVLHIINDLNSHGARPLPMEIGQPTFIAADFSLSGVVPTNFVDVNGDEFVSPLDVLLVINELNQPGGSHAQASVPAATAAAVRTTGAEATNSTLNSLDLTFAVPVTSSLTVAPVTQVTSPMPSSLVSSPSSYLEPPSGVIAWTTNEPPVDLFSPYAKVPTEPTFLEDPFGNEETTSAGLDSMLTEIAEDISAAWEAGAV